MLTLQTQTKPTKTLIPMTRVQKEQETAEKLKLILARALSKERDGIELTVKEDDLLSDLYRKMHEKRRETMSVDADGTVRIKKTVDAEPIMDAVKAYGDFVTKHTQSKLAQRYVGSLDPITAFKWMQESGAKVGSKEFAKFAMNRIKNDNEYRRFRVGGL